MHTQVARWGNSLAVRLPRSLTEAAGLAEGSAVELDVLDRAVRIRPSAPRYRLEELLARITPDNLPDSFDDGPVGEELL